MKTSISTLEELHQEKQNLKIEIQASKSAFVEAAKASGDQFSNNLFKPVNFLNIATQGLGHWMNGAQEDHSTNKEIKSKTGWFNAALPILLKLVERILSNRNK